MILEFFRAPMLDAASSERLREEIIVQTGVPINAIGTEWRYYIEVDGELDPHQRAKLGWLLGETFGPDHGSFGYHYNTLSRSFITLLEVGPRPSFETAWSSTAVAICHRCGIPQVVRIERFRRYGFQLGGNATGKDALERVLPLLTDRMTEQLNQWVPKTFAIDVTPQPVRTIPLIEGGMAVLQEENGSLGLGMDEQDLGFCLALFADRLRRNPTDVELYQLAQANSEHCRHGFFKGQLIIDGEPVKWSLMEVVKAPWQANPGNSLIAFGDDSSAIGVPWSIETILPTQPGQPAPLELRKVRFHPTLTAETHNFPSGVAPYPGATTGTGGRIRDNLSVGRGGIMGVAGAAYCTGNLLIPGFVQPWEESGWPHPAELGSPLEIMVRASNGASDYGNCFGEPVIYGFTRTCGLELPDGYRSWFKPIMYTAGAGQISQTHVTKGNPEKGMFVVQIGGPAYRIGMGGGAASSMMQGDNQVELDFNAVQRGAPEMEQRVWRAIRACIELGDKNPIVSIHDLGAGGDCSALPEIVVPAGAVIQLRALPVGDKSLSAVEIWANESQEREALLIRAEDLESFELICQRESVPCAVVGQVTGDKMLILHDTSDGSTPVNLPLTDILEELPRKTFRLDRITPQRVPLELPANLAVIDALERVLRLPAVASKRFLTSKVDRSVTGLVAQQQCVGPHQVTLCDYGVMAQSHFGLTGMALSLGEQPIKGLISPAAMARLAVAEALLNMAGVRVTSLEDVRCSANWMWAAKLPGEGAALYEAACSLRDILIELGVAIDGGKDSLSMAAKTMAPDGTKQVVKAPGQLVIANYAPVADITCKVTPDLGAGDQLLLIDLSMGKSRLGGSALAQAFEQVGDECPDIEDIQLLKRAFIAVQELVSEGLITAVHDRSDGGMLVAVLEMAFAGAVGLHLAVEGSNGVMECLFNEEAGLLLGFREESWERISAILSEQNIPGLRIGSATPQGTDVLVTYQGETVLADDMLRLRSLWEETSSHIERRQANPDCARQEERVISNLTALPPYKTCFIPHVTDPTLLRSHGKPKVAILREQGSNGDREMAASFWLAGFEPWDVTMSDLLTGQVTLDQFRGVVFVGGFSYGDVMDAGKGWAGVIRFNEQVQEQFDRFYRRTDSFSLGVCNGCQLSTLLGWVPWYDLSPDQRPRFIRNLSGRFESRFATVRIEQSPAIMLQGMEGSTLGVWVAHGEGRLHLPESSQLDVIVADGLAPIRFVNWEGDATEGSLLSYPSNPNGSPVGITALCSPDGRHLAMMPHPERTTHLWNWPWLPKGWKEMEASPWLQMFQNAYNWCQQ